MERVRGVWRWLDTSSRRYPLPWGAGLGIAMTLLWGRIMGVLWAIPIGLLWFVLFGVVKEYGRRRRLAAGVPLDNERRPGQGSNRP